NTSTASSVPNNARSRIKCTIPERRARHEQRSTICIICTCNNICWVSHTATTRRPPRNPVGHIFQTLPCRGDSIVHRSYNSGDPYLVLLYCTSNFDHPVCNIIGERYIDNHSVLEDNDLPGTLCHINGKSLRRHLKCVET